MKRSIVILLTVSLTYLVSCTTSKMVISTEAFDYKLKAIDQDVLSLKEGYLPISIGTKSNDNVKVAGYSYSQYTGVNTILENENEKISSYSYEDSVGKAIVFYIKYKIEKDYYSNSYIYDINVESCLCQDKVLYPYICGEDGVVNNILKIKPDQLSVFYSPRKTSALLYVLCLIPAMTILATL